VYLLFLRYLVIYLVGVPQFCGDSLFSLFIHIYGYIENQYFILIFICDFGSTEVKNGLNFMLCVFIDG
jgi:hypothetical protein